MCMDHRFFLCVIRPETKSPAGCGTQGFPWYPRSRAKVPGVQSPDLLFLNLWALARNAAVELPGNYLYRQIGQLRTLSTVSAANGNRTGIVALGFSHALPPK
jgi:hypothetical protein